MPTLVNNRNNSIYLYTRFTYTKQRNIFLFLFFALESNQIRKQQRKKIVFIVSHGSPCSLEAMEAEGIEAKVDIRAIGIIFSNPVTKKKLVFFSLYVDAVVCGHIPVKPGSTFIALT